MSPDKKRNLARNRNLVRKCYLFGNCQIKVIADYFKAHKPFASLYTEIKYHYIEDPITRIDNDMEYIKSCDLFIFQHCSKEALKTELEAYTPQYLAEHVVPKTCQVISIPSIYFNTDFINPTCTSNSDLFPKWTFNKDIYQMILEKRPVAELIEYYEKKEYSDQEIQDHIKTAFFNLESREKQNAVTIPISPYLRDNYLKLRLMHTTNHPTKHIYNYMLNRVYDLLQIQQDHTIMQQQDKMVKYGHSFILPCVRRYYERHGRIDTSDYMFTCKGAFFCDVHEYFAFLLQQQS